MLKKLVVAGTILLVAAAAFAQYAIGFRNIVGMLRYDQRREGDLKVGDAAPDVVLSDLAGNNAVHLVGAARGRPLVLVFGSYT